MSVLFLPSSPKEEKVEEGSSLNFGETGMRQSYTDVVGQ